MQAVGVDLARRHGANRNLGRTAEDSLKQLLPAGGGELFRVVQKRQRPNAMVAQALVVEQHAGDDERPRERAPARFVRTGDEPRA